MKKAKFKLGDKVMCIDDNFEPAARKWIKVYPKFLETYFVKRVILEKNGKYGILLDGIYNPPLEYKGTYREITFDENRFVLIEPDNTKEKELNCNLTDEIEDDLQNYDKKIYKILNKAII